MHDPFAFLNRTENSSVKAMKDLTKAVDALTKYVLERKVGFGKHLKALEVRPEREAHGDWYFCCDAHSSSSEALLSLQLMLTGVPTGLQSCIPNYNLSSKFFVYAG